MYKIVEFAKVVNGWKSFTIFPKTSILDVWQGSEYASDKGFSRIRSQILTFYRNYAVCQIQKQSDISRGLEKFQIQLFLLF